MSTIGSAHSGEEPSLARISSCGASTLVRAVTSSVLAAVLIVTCLAAVGQHPSWPAAALHQVSGSSAAQLELQLGSWSLSGNTSGSEKPVAMVVKDPVAGVGAPLGKQVVVGMDNNVEYHVAWNDWKPWKAQMSPFWTEDMVYDFIYVGDWDFGVTHGLHAWFLGEHLHYNAAIPDCQFVDFIRAATHSTCTSASYGNGRWVAPFAGVPPPPSHPWVTVSDVDFYLLQGNRIRINWCMVDVVNLFEQVGYHVLPPAPLPYDGYLPARAEDGFPAPLSAMVDEQDTIQSEALWKAAVREDFLDTASNASHWSDDMVWYGPGGIGTAHSKSEYQKFFLTPLQAAFSQLELTDEFLVCEGNYCGAHFYVYGLHTGPWLGEQASGKRVALRMGAHARIRHGKILEGWLQIDIPRAFKDMGVDLYARAKLEAARVAAADLRL